MRQTVYFIAPQRVEVRTDPVPEPQPDEVLVRTTCTAISPGTERLIYEGKAPQHMQADASIGSLGGDLSYPLAYGYCAVGVVQKVGSAASSDSGRPLEGRRVFAFQPHTSHFTAPPASLTFLPDEISDEDALLIPSLETAITLTLDGRPRIGERVVVLGQGLVGLLTTALLARFPLDVLITTDPRPSRRRISLQLGATHALDPGDPAFGRTLSRHLGIEAWGQSKEQGGGGADLCIEVSGQPEALDQAICAVGYNGTVLIGSWYGNKPVSMNLGGSFHRDRIAMISSQVSTLSPGLKGRWTKKRRLQYVFKSVPLINASHIPLVRYPISQVSDAYAGLLRGEGEAILPVIVYDC